MKARKYKVNWPMQTAAILVCLVLLTTSMLSGFYAKFTVTSASGDTARTASFNITDDLSEQIQNIGISMAPGDGTDPAIAYNITITNESEVAVRYKLEFIRETDNLPLDLSWTGTQEGYYIGQFPPNSGGDASNTLTLNIRWPQNENDYELSNQVDLITVRLTVEQID